MFRKSKYDAITTKKTADFINKKKMCVQKENKFCFGLDSKTCFSEGWTNFK